MNLRETHALTVLLAGMHDQKMSASTAYAVASNHKALLGHAEHYEATRIEIVLEHAAKDESGECIVEDGNYKIADDHAFSAAIDDLAKTEVDVSLKQVGSDDFGQLTPNEVSILSAMMADLDWHFD